MVVLVLVLAAAAAAAVDMLQITFINGAAFTIEAAGSSVLMSLMQVAGTSFGCRGRSCSNGQCNALDVTSVTGCCSITKHLTRHHRQ